MAGKEKDFNGAPTPSSPPPVVEGAGVQAPPSPQLDSVVTTAAPEETSKEKEQAAVKQAGVPEEFIFVETGLTYKSKVWKAGDVLKVSNMTEQFKAVAFKKSEQIRVWGKVHLVPKV